MFPLCCQHDGNIEHEKISTLLGILVDVSGSMKESIVGGVNEEGGPWARSIFTVIDDLISYDVSGSNKVFAVGFGTKDRKIFDILTSIRRFPAVEDVHGPVTEETIEEILVILQRSGACSLRKWIDKNIILNSASEMHGRLILLRLRWDKTFRKRFVYEYLPKGCRDIVTDDLYANICLAPFVGLIQGIQELVSSGVSQFREATREDIERIVEKAITYLKTPMVEEVQEQSIYSVPDAAEILRGRFSKSDLTRQNSKKLLQLLEPYIYGNTPLYTALGGACNLLSNSKYKNHRKLLFVLSDGEPSDFLEDILPKLERAKVTVVGCYIAKDSQVEPRRLYSVADDLLEYGARFLFNLSSSIPSELVTRAVFLKQGWNIDIEDNSTRLFLHVNHPDNLKDVCDLARNVVTSQEALSELLTSVSLDIYINQVKGGITAHKQEGGTCYANASASVLHLTMNRILGRVGGYPTFEEIRDNLIQLEGTRGANTFQMLRKICPKYRLRCKEVNAKGALQAISEKHLVVATFRLTENEWDNFEDYYRKNRIGILKQCDLDISKRVSNVETTGHAVVLTSYNSECLRLMNSWGSDWADMGFFRIENADVLNLQFMDVFWVEKDLLKREKTYYRKHGSERAKKLMDSLKGLKQARFTCPLCGENSNVTEFRGTLSKAVCPECNEEFSSDRANDNILALNMYLTSLSR